MINAPYDKEFVFHDGTRSKNITELLFKIESLDDHEFHQFVNDSKNDFANWIEYVLSDLILAEKLCAVRSKIDSIKVIRDRIQDMTIGNSIIKIPRIEEHVSNSQISDQTSMPMAELRAAMAESRFMSTPNGTVTVSRVDQAIADHGSINSSNYVDSNPTIGNISNRPPNKLLEIFSRKRATDVSDKFSHEHIIKAAEVPAELHAQKIPKHDVHKDVAPRYTARSDAAITGAATDAKVQEGEVAETIISEGHENVLWVALYLLLVLLIVLLLVYKLFLS